MSSFPIQRSRRRRGFTVVELLAAVAILSVILASVPAVLAVVAAGDRATTARRLALYELSNLQTRLAAGEEQPALRVELATYLPGADLTIDRKPAGDWEQVTLTLAWQPGGPDTPARRESLVSLQPVADDAASEEQP